MTWSSYTGGMVHVQYPWGRKFTRIKRRKVSNPFPADSDVAHSPNPKFLFFCWSPFGPMPTRHTHSTVCSNGWLETIPKEFYDPLADLWKQCSHFIKHMELCSSTKLEQASHAQSLMGTFAKCSHPQLVARTATKRTHISSSAFAKCHCNIYTYICVYKHQPAWVVYMF